MFRGPAARYQRDVTVDRAPTSCEAHASGWVRSLTLITWV
jgi:hypothetical protein